MRKKYNRIISREVVQSDDLSNTLNTYYTNQEHRVKTIKKQCIYPNGELGNIYVQDEGDIPKTDIIEKDIMDYFEEKDKATNLKWRMEVKAQDILGWLGKEI